MRYLKASSIFRDPKGPPRTVGNVSERAYRRKTCRRRRKTFDIVQQFELGLAFERRDSDD
jgi:hypothetical protein